MKTRILLRLSLLPVFGGLVFLSGPTRVAATDDDPPPGDQPPAAAAPALPDADQAAAPAVTAVPAGVYLSPSAEGIAKLARAGVTEDVMTAYVATVTSPFNLGSEQIVYLNDLGVSGSVVKAMIQRDTEIAAGNAVPAALPPPVIAPPTVSIPDAGDPLAADDSDTPTYADDFTPTDDSDYFYNSLLPYGSWLDVPGYGTCWQPTVYTVNHSWQPYCDRGRWIATDCGWYWQSDYSWGWAAFHYGRWLHRGAYGWVWVPERTWGPAWVSWRHSADVCGWAPLPPSAHFVPGKGYEFRHLAVGPEFEFGLRARHYTFIPTARMTDYSPTRYAVSSPGTAYQQTVVANHITMQNNRVVTHGIDPALVAHAAGTEPRHARVQEATGAGARPLRTDQIDKQNGNFVIYRPQLPAPVHPSAGALPARPQPAAPARGPGVPRHSLNNDGAPPVASLAQSAPPSGTSHHPPARVDDRPLPNMNFADRAAHPEVTSFSSQVATPQTEPGGTREFGYPPGGSAAYAPPVLALPGHSAQTPPVNRAGQASYPASGNSSNHPEQAPGEPANNARSVYVIPGHYSVGSYAGRTEPVNNPIRSAPGEQPAPMPRHADPPALNNPPPVVSHAPAPPPPAPPAPAPSHSPPPAPAPSSKK